LKTPVAGLFAGLLFCFVGTASAADLVTFFKPLKLEGNNVRWFKTDQNGQITLRYSLVAENVDFPRARNCRKLAPLDQLLESSGVSKDAVRQEITAAFAMWEAAANISFREAASPADADILIGAQLEPEGWAFADVFYDVMSAESVKPISKALVCLNPIKQWKIGFDGNLQIYDLRYTIAHEIGHAIGLDHPSGAGQIMGYRYEERFRTLQEGDVKGAALLYGTHSPGIGTAAAEPQQTDPPRTSRAELSAKRSGTRAFPARGPQ
jgi:hypothetical protein